MDQCEKGGIWDWHPVSVNNDVCTLIKTALGIQLARHTNNLAKHNLEFLLKHIKNIDDIKLMYPCDDRGKIITSSATRDEYFPLKILKVNVGDVIQLTWSDHYDFYSSATLKEIMRWVVFTKTVRLLSSHFQLQKFKLLIEIIQ